MKDYDNLDKKYSRKDNVTSKKKVKKDISEEEKFQRKNAKQFKQKIREIQEEEKWEDWQDEVY